MSNEEATIRSDSQWKAIDGQLLRLSDFRLFLGAKVDDGVGIAADKRSLTVPSESSAVWLIPRLR